MTIDKKLHFISFYFLDCLSLFLCTYNGYYEVREKQEGMSLPRRREVQF